MTTFETVKVTREDGLTWVTLNRPDKRNAMNPTMHHEMVQILDDLADDSETLVMILTGAGESFCAGMDLKEYFRDLADKPAEKRRANWESQEWRWRRLWTFPKPTIAMVNGFCFGGAFTPLIACDIAIAADDAVFGLSEINWGVFPGGLVSRVLSEVMGSRDAMYYTLTGETFTGSQAAGMGLVTRSVPRSGLRAETTSVARSLTDKNPLALKAAKEAFKLSKSMDFMQAEDYIITKTTALQATDPKKSREEGIRQFIEEKTYRPGFGTFTRAADG